MRTRLTTFSLVAVLLAAAASLGTSPPEPDWTVEDDASGELTLLPEDVSKTFRFKVTSKVVGGSTEISLAVDPRPVHTEDVDRTPLVFFVGSPRRVVGEDQPVSVTPYPPRYFGKNDVFSPTTRGTFAAGVTDEVFEVTIAWDDPSDGGAYAASITRPKAPKAPMKIRWLAHAASSGYDDKPAGASVDVEPVP